MDSKSKGPESEIDMWKFYYMVAEFSDNKKYLLSLNLILNNNQWYSYWVYCAFLTLTDSIVLPVQIRFRPDYFRPASLLKLAVGTRMQSQLTKHDSLNILQANNEFLTLVISSTAVQYVYFWIYYDLDRRKWECNSIIFLNISDNHIWPMSWKIQQNIIIMLPNGPN